MYISIVRLRQILTYLLCRSPPHWTSIHTLKILTEATAYHCTEPWIWWSATTSCTSALRSRTASPCSASSTALMTSPAPARSCTSRTRSNALALSWRGRVSVKKWICILYGFPCEMDFLTTSLWIPAESLATRVGFWDDWWEIHLTWKTVQNAFSRILNTP